MLSRCKNCAGRKQLIGLGCIYQNCPTCKGIGHVEIDEVINAIEHKEDEVPAKIVKLHKRGRPRKYG